MPVNKKRKETIDYTAERDFETNTTTFTWYNLADAQVDKTFVKETTTSGIFEFLKVGTYYCKMSNAYFAGTELTTENITIEGKAQSIIFVNTPSSVKVNDMITIVTNASSGLEVRFELISGDATLTGNSITFNKEGTVKIKAIQDGNEEFNAAEKTIEISVEKKVQNINFENASQKVKVKEVLELIATASSGLEVRFELTSGDATLTGKSITFNKEGTVKIKAIQDGNEEFNAAEKTIEISVEKKVQNINFENASQKVKVKEILELIATASSGLEVRFEQTSGDAILTGNSITFNKEGTVRIKAIQDGNEEFNAAEKTIEISVEKKVQNINFENAPQKLKVKEVLELIATASSGLEVRFELISGDATLTGNSITFNKEGTVKIKAIQDGNKEFNAAEKTIEISVEKKVQNINFENTPMEVRVNDVLELNATASSGLEVSYKAIKGEISISGNAITFHKAGNVIIKAIQAGNDEYNEAEQSYLIIVQKKEQSITFQNLSSKVSVKDELELYATASSELEVNFEVISGEATISGNTVIFTKAGTVEIKATQDGNEFFLPTEGSISIEVEKIAQKITIGSFAKKVEVGDVLEIKAASDSDLEVDFEVSLGEASITENTITFTKAGTVEINAMQAGNDTYLAAEEKITILVEKKIQSITINSYPEKVKVKEELELDATTDSELEVSFEIISGDASISEKTITFNKAGTVEIKAIQEGNEIFAPTERVIEIVVEKRDQSITFENVPEKVEVNNVLELQASASSGLVVSYEIIAGDATLNGNSVTFNQEGTVQIKAIQEGNDEYAETEEIVEIQVEVATGLDEIAKNAFRIYPNPVERDLTIELEGNEKCMIRIYDMRGKLVLQKESNSKQEQFNLSGFSAGMYLLKLQIGEETITRKILKK
ncbi:MAG: T9SS type A sorting domain-containing protein [Marinifilaceae bacterium]